MKWIVLLALAAALVLLPAAAASGATTRKCTDVAFTANSEDMAARIRATGLTCGLARDFVRDSKGRPGARFRGFACTGTRVEDGLPYTRYRCADGEGDVIRWRRY